MSARYTASNGSVHPFPRRDPQIILFAHANDTNPSLYHLRGAGANVRQPRITQHLSVNPRSDTILRRGVYLLPYFGDLNEKGIADVERWWGQLALRAMYRIEEK